MKNKPSPKMKFLRDGMISRINVQLRSSSRRRGRQRAVVQRRRGGVCGRDEEEVYVVCSICFSLYNQCPGENRSLRRAVVYY